MLRRIDYSRFRVDLYVEQLDGELMGEIPAQVTVRALESYSRKQLLIHPLFAGKKAAILWYLHRKKRPFPRQCLLYGKLLLPIRERYDVAVSYHAPNTTPMFYVMDRMRADRKVLWLHGDLAKNAGDMPLVKAYHSKYDKVVAVCGGVYESFLKLHPDEREKACIFYNLLDAPAMREKAKAGPVFGDGFSGPRILTIARLDPQKGVDLAVEACAKLVSAGREVRWYVCGEGDCRLELEEQIAEKGLGGRFFLLGDQENPYGYLQDCDLYVQPSRTEGYCTTTNEARLLAKPVITTDVSGAREQFEDGVTGWIVPIDADAIAEKVEWVLDHPDVVKAVVTRLRQGGAEADAADINLLLEMIKNGDQSDRPGV